MFFLTFSLSIKKSNPKTYKKTTGKSLGKERKSRWARQRRQCLFIGLRYSQNSELTIDQLERLAGSASSRFARYPSCRFGYKKYMYFVISKTTKTGNQKLKSLASGHKKSNINKRTNKKANKERKSGKEVS